MNTPICDFVKNYISQKNERLHMPGHKGCGLLGFEQFDITEIAGADSLYEANGIIKQSEQNASALFGSDTFYSTEGSSHCIRAMLYLAMSFCGNKNRLIAAGRNAHKAFLTAAALLDLDIDWLCGSGENYLSLNFSAEDMEDYFKSAATLPFAVYLTSPDYLGNRLDIKKISEVCRRYKVLLLIDNAHGAYLKFLQNSQHPIDLGADLCCDSAHKTLPVLTGGAYLHIKNSLHPFFKNNAKQALAMFGSTSPSYLILQSLDMANKYLYGYKENLAAFIKKVEKLKKALEDYGYTLIGNEPLKITILASAYGYNGTEIAEYMQNSGLIAEFFDADFITLMLTPENSDNCLSEISDVLKNLPKKERIKSTPPSFTLPTKKISVRKAAFSQSEIVKTQNALGRIAALPTVGCPPAVPIVMSGELIDQNVINTLEYYGIKETAVVI